MGYYSNKVEKELKDFTDMMGSNEVLITKLTQPEILHSATTVGVLALLCQTLAGTCDELREIKTALIGDKE